MSLLDWIESLPRGWHAQPLRSTVDYVVSNVDKVPADDEIPVRLCNYTDVYNNEFITLALEFMQATATKDEIAKFGLRVDDVAITKDSESWDDIGVPALVHVAEHGTEVHLAVAQRAKAPGPVDPGLIAAVHALATVGAELGVLDVKRLDA